MYLYMHMRCVRVCLCACKMQLSEPIKKKRKKRKMGGDGGGGGRPRTGALTARKHLCKKGGGVLSKNKTFTSKTTPRANHPAYKGRQKEGFFVVVFFVFLCNF